MSQTFNDTQDPNKPASSAAEFIAGSREKQILVLPKNVPVILIAAFAASLGCTAKYVGKACFCFEPVDPKNPDLSPLPAAAKQALRDLKKARPVFSAMNEAFAFGSAQAAQTLPENDG